MNQFAEERPKHAELIGIRDEARNRILESLAVDFREFNRWLGGRPLGEAAKPRLGRRDRWNKGLAKAVLFLQFVLTRGYWSAREFGSFRDNPPRGPLEPCDPVPVEQIKSWARKAGIETENKLSKAKQKAGVKHRQGGRPRERWSEWFLPGPVTIARPPWEKQNGTTLANGDSASNGTAQPAKKKGGNPAKDSALATLQFCYFWRIVNGKSKAQVFDKANIAVKNGELKKAPPDEANVNKYAKRYAYKFTPPLSLERGNAQAKIDYERSLAALQEKKKP